MSRRSAAQQRRAVGLLLSALLTIDSAVQQAPTLSSNGATASAGLQKQMRAVSR